MPILEVGQPFPQFALPNQDSQVMSMRDFSGKWLVVYVYPKDDTPGCTLEGRAFSAAKAQYDEAGAMAVGISEDDVSSHKSFCNKYSFTIPLLADTKAELLTAMGVEQSEYKGEMYWNRTTFLVDPKGILRKIYKNVNPDGHEIAVLEDIKKMQSH